MESPEWLDLDRALMLALELHEDSLCPGCARDARLAWQTDSGWWVTTTRECGPCTAKQKRRAELDGEDTSKVQPVTYLSVYLDPAYPMAEMPPPLEAFPEPPPPHVPPPDD